MAVMHNHAFTFGFAVETRLADASQIPVADLRHALLTKLAEMDDTELGENLGAPFDSYEFDVDDASTLNSPQQQKEPA